jgi:hypothetical protein
LRGAQKILPVCAGPGGTARHAVGLKNWRRGVPSTGESPMPPGPAHTGMKNNRELLKIHFNREDAKRAKNH